MLRILPRLRAPLYARHLLPSLIPSLISAVLLGSCQPATEPGTSLSSTDMSDASAVTPNRALGFMQSYVHVADHADLDLRQKWTLEAWVNPRAAGNGADEDLISKWAGITDAAYILQIDEARPGRFGSVPPTGSL